MVKTYLQHIVMAATMNFVRIRHWLLEKSLAKTQLSAFEKLIRQLLLSHASAVSKVAKN